MNRQPGIHPSAIIGSNCDIALGVSIGADAVIGNSVRIGPGCIVSGRCSIGDQCILAAGCILDAGDDDSSTGTILESGVQLLAGVTVAASITIATGALIEAGTVLLRPVPPHALVSGNPAQITGYRLSDSNRTSSPPPPRDTTLQPVEQTTISGVTLHRLPRIIDLRGNLTVGEFERSIPFMPRRYFLVFEVPNAEVRGEHAHRTCKQFLICVKGSCHVVADDGTNREEFILDDPSIGLYLPPKTWGIQYKYSHDAVLLVFASEYYDTQEYIREYEEFSRLSLPSSGNF